MSKLFTQQTESFIRRKETEKKGVATKHFLTGLVLGLMLGMIFRGFI